MVISLIEDILFQWLTIPWKVFPPHRYVATVVFLWGLIATLQAATQTWAGMMVCRFFLGVVECGFGPGIPLFLSFFYPRHEIGLRIGIFLSGAALASAYGGALAYALRNCAMDIVIVVHSRGCPELFIGDCSLVLPPRGPFKMYLH